MLRIIQIHPCEFLDTIQPICYSVIVNIEFLCDAALVAEVSEIGFQRFKQFFFVGQFR